jgi:septal ring factor EnvC (AmiA/AmiB activator)
MPNASITRHFGKQNVQGSTVQIDVQGIDLTTLPSQAVRSVFAGEVESVMTIPGQGKMVIISHGTFYTVFANLGTVSVKVKDKVSMLSNIGTVRTDPASGESKLYFQMNQDKVALDPELWLVKKN